MQADGGQLVLSAGAANSALASVVNNTGVMQARTTTISKGRIVLSSAAKDGQLHLSGTLNASGGNLGEGGTVHTQASVIKVSDSARVDTRSTAQSWGTWSLEQNNAAQNTADSKLSSMISGAALGEALNHSNVSLFTDKDLQIDTPVAWNAPSKLSLVAHKNIAIDASVNATNPNGQLSLAYDGAESLRAHGRLGQQAVWLDYPWVRNSQYQLKSRVQLEYMDPRDHQDASNIKTDRQLRILSLSANQENTDAFMAGGLSQIYAELTHGHTDFTNQVAAANDEVTARTAGRFTKVNLRGYRNQAINPLFSLSLSMDGQWAQKNLDATQKFSLGGLRSVRAYEAGALSADTGIFSSVELRMLLPPPDDNWNIQGQWYASVFWDKAVARVNKNPWSNTSNLAHLRGTGLAMYWQGPNEWRATVSVGKSLGSVSSLLNSSDAIHKTAWLELAKAWR